MILGIGVDIVEIDKLRLAMIRRGERLRDRAFTRSEIDYCEGRANKFQHYSARFAAKEAMFKAIGTGWRTIRIGIPCAASRDSKRCCESFDAPMPAMQESHLHLEIAHVFVHGRGRLFKSCWSMRSAK